MKIKTVAFALALVLAPAFSLAEGCGLGKSHQAMSCAEGSTFDSTTNTRVPVAT